MDLLSGSLPYIVGTVFLLGLLIAIHEFGHFWVAKLCGMKVEVFSIGFGPKLFQKQHGETEYTLSLFPLGGYVKILGQDPREEISKEETHRSFQKMSLWKRTAVVLAGPIANFILAVFVFALVFSFGNKQEAPSLTSISQDSPAHKAGFRSGDTVQSIALENGEVESISNMRELTVALDKHKNQNLKFKLLRNDQAQSVQYTPSLQKTREYQTGIPKEMGFIDGLHLNARGSSFTIQENSWAARNNFPGAFYTSEATFNGEKFSFKSFQDFKKFWKENVTQNSGTLEFSYLAIDLGDEKLFSENKEIATITINESTPKSLSAAGILSSELLVTKVMKDGAAEKAGIKKGDVITAVNGKKIFLLQEFIAKVEIAAENNSKLIVEWLQNGQLIQKEIIPKVQLAKDPYTGLKKNRYLVGIVYGAGAPALPKTVLIKAKNPVHALGMGFAHTWDTSKRILVNIWDLVTAKISMKKMSSPLMIGKIAGDSLKMGIIPFLNVIAFISINLFIFNLLPIPVLDGGHLTLFAVEAIVRKPLPIKAVEIWTMSGFVLLMGLFVFVFFNDISKMFF